jgi:phosphoribosyl 1,2-cyclic phosphodiesterase
MRVHILGSGSEGNAIVIESERQRILVDAGFGVRELSRRLRLVDVEPETVTALIVTHEHHDHVRGAGAAARRYQWPVYATAGTLKAKGGAKRVAGESEVPKAVAIDRDPPKPAARSRKRIVKHVVNTQQEVELDDFTLRFVKAPHDAREPVAIIATTKSTGERVGIAYDLGHLTERFIRQFSDLDVLVLESNHDSAMLRTGPYPWSLKQRVAGPNGHLSNAEAALMARSCVHRGLRHVVLCHLSHVNNRPDIAIKTIRSALRGTGFRGALQVAPQHSTLTLGGAAQIELAL